MSGDLHEFETYLLLLSLILQTLMVRGLVLTLIDPAMMCKLIRKGLADESSPEEESPSKVTPAYIHI